MKTVILSTGDELTTGRIVDTNSSWIADKLFERGIEVVAVLTVGDDRERLGWAWRRGLELGDVVISTGGIGPTADDLTSEVVADVLGVPLVEDAASADRIRQLFAALGREMPLNNLTPALFPRGAEIIPHAFGTAPGYRAAHGGRHVVVLPGVPREMKPMMEETVIPWLLGLRGGDTVYLAQTFQTFGLTESGLDEMVAGAIDPSEGRVSFRASFPEISLRVVVHGAPADARARLEALAARVRERIGPYVYGEGVVTMEEVVGRLLSERGLGLALAESCTGGLIGHRLTNVPGSSAWFRGAVVPYGNDAKTWFGVRGETLAAHGAVSEATAGEMASAARRVLGADLGIGLTGIAGPDGGTPDKPVGTVCLALASEGGAVTRRYQLWGARDWVKLLASQVALDWVRRHLLGLPVTESRLFRPRGS